MTAKNLLAFIKKLVKLIKKRLVVAVILVVVISGVLYQNYLSNQLKTGTTYTVKEQTLQEKLIFSGEIDADEKATLKFQTPGKLAWIGVKEGDIVNQYQTIASLDQRSVRKELGKKLNLYAKTRLDFDQTQDDNEVVVNDRIKRILEKAQFDLTNSVIDVELQDLTIQFSSISTPISGVVTNLTHPNAGVNVGVTEQIAEIVNPETVYFSASADQTDLPNIKEGMSGEIIFDAYPDVTVPATVRSISFTPKEDETGTVYDVKIDFDADNSTFQYRLGMTGDIEFIIKERPAAYVVPSAYIKKEGEKSYVTKIVKGRRVKTEVKIGETIDNLTEVLSGLKEGDVVYDQTK